MPKINVYLSDELAEAVREANIPVSTICQRALEQAVRRIAAVHETIQADDLSGAFEQATKFTGRTRVLLAMAVDAAKQEGRAVGTEDLLAALIDEGDGLGLRVLRAMEIEPREVSGALDARRTGGSGSGFTAHAQEALRLAAAESTALGHGYIGTEHLLLGLIAEPNGPAGQVLRGSGADIRQARRAVPAAIAGWFAAGERATPADLSAELSNAIREQLAPIVARLDRLEQRS
jgi:ATP-dependent Clp protease ATP-binding subunit ClpA